MEIILALLFVAMLINPIIGFVYWLWYKNKKISFVSTGEQLGLIFIPFIYLGKLKHRLLVNSEVTNVLPKMYYIYKFMALVNTICLAVTILAILVFTAILVIFFSYESDGYNSSWGELGIDLIAEGISALLIFVVIIIAIVIICILVAILVGIPLLMARSEKKSYRSRMLVNEINRLRKRNNQGN